MVVLGNFAMTYISKTLKHMEIMYPVGFTSEFVRQFRLIGELRVPIKMHDNAEDFPSSF